MEIFKILIGTVIGIILLVVGGVIFCIGEEEDSTIRCIAGVILFIVGLAFLKGVFSLLFNA